MNESESIVCKPTPWFLFRALVMMAMFGVFAVLFFLDGSTGYRKKNEAYCYYKTFEAANGVFSRMNTEGTLTPEDWQRFAAKQQVAFPKDTSILPASLKLPVPWPAVLCDYNRMKPLQWNLLWRDFSKEHGYDVKPEEIYDDGKIKSQWIVFWVCLGFTSVAAFVLVRTLRRSISADDQAITTVHGRRVPYADLKSLDLRKWETKGLAFIDYDGPSGKGRIRIDGLTYGGFKPENQEPAERLMRRIREHFAGEIIEYATLTPAQLPAAEEPANP